MLKKWWLKLLNFLGFHTSNGKQNKSGIKKEKKDLELEIVSGNKSELKQSNASSIDAQVSQDLAVQKQEVKEMPWFTRENDLVNEFIADPTPVYSSKFGSYEDEEVKPLYYLDGYGRPFKIEEKEEDGVKKEVKVYDDSLTPPDTEKFTDDVSDIPNLIKINREKPTTYVFGEKPQGLGDDQSGSETGDKL